MRVRTHTNPFNFYTRLDRLNLADIFNEPANPLDFEIGFGRGLFLRQWAMQYPNRNIVGAEIRKSIVALLEDQVKADAISNVHLINGNGEIILEDCFEDEALSRIFVFHPDPWFKKSHHKRRVIRLKFLEIAAKKLKADGKIYISTDVEELWEAMIEAFSNSPYFKQIDDPEFWATSYNSEWHQLREKEKRSFYFGTFIKISVP